MLSQTNTTSDELLQCGLNSGGGSKGSSKGSRSAGGGGAATADGEGLFTAKDAGDQKIADEAQSALERGGALAVIDRGALASNRKGRIFEQVKVGNRVYRKRVSETPLEATKAARVKVYDRKDKIDGQVRALKRENSKLKGKENASARAANAAKIKRLESQSVKYDRMGNRLISRERELKNKGVSFRFSQATSSREVLGVALNRSYSANRVLGLKPGASVSDATQAYRSLARRYHPDNNKGLTPTQVQRNNRKFQLATEAYKAYKEFAPRALGVK